MTIVTALSRALWIGMLAVRARRLLQPALLRRTRPSPPSRREPEITLYELEVDAPSERLRELLLEHLDLARFQKAPKSDAISGPELDRLASPRRRRRARCSRPRATSMPT